MHSVLINGLARQGRGPLATQIAPWDDSGIWTTAYSQARQKPGRALTPTMPREHETRPVGELHLLVLPRLLNALWKKRAWGRPTVSTSKPMKQAAHPAFRLPPSGPALRRCRPAAGDLRAPQTWLQ